MRPFDTDAAQKFMEDNKLNMMAIAIDNKEFYVCTIVSGKLLYKKISGWIAE